MSGTKIRSFLLSLPLIFMFFSLEAAATQASDAAKDAPMQVDAVITLTDWTGMGGAWGKVGIYRIMQHAKRAGIKRVYWRVFNGGTAIYPSKIASVQGGRSNFENWNPAVDAVEIAHQLGLEIHAWYTLFEEDHGSGHSSSFLKDHPEYMQMDRHGKKYAGTLDFFYDEVRQYKLKIIDEIISFGFDGMLLDYVRHNAVPSADVKTNIHRFGYNPEIVAAFKKRSGKDAFKIDTADEEWIKFKAEPHTKLIREIRKRLKAANPKSQLSLMLWPVDNLRWTALDVPAITKENLVEMLTASSIKYTFHPREAKEQIRILRAQNRSDRVRIAPGICCYNGISASAFEEYVKTAEELGINELIMYESNYLVSSKLSNAVGNINRGVANYKRTLKAALVKSKIDWSKIPVYDDLIVIRGSSDKSRNKTSFQIAYNNKNLYVKFFCEDKQPKKLLPAERNEDDYYLSALGPRHYWAPSDSFNVLLDADHGHENFYHFKVYPDGFKIQQTRIDDRWQGKWNADVEVDSKGWGGVITIPLKTINVEKSRQMGINLIRTERATVKTAGEIAPSSASLVSKEISAWFRSSSRTITPEQLGHITFE